jgi:sigma-B regulation protein RsbU (phosphoserine phosphatase)
MLRSKKRVRRSDRTLATVLQPPWCDVVVQTDGRRQYARRRPLNAGRFRAYTTLRASVPIDPLRFVEARQFSFIAKGRIPREGDEIAVAQGATTMSLPDTLPPSETEPLRRDTEIAVAAFRTIFLLIVLSSPQFQEARGAGLLLVAAVVAATLYNVVLFVLHIRSVHFPRPVIVLVDAFLVSLWIYIAGADGERFFVLYFAIVAVAGLWLGLGAALAVGVFASALYVYAALVAPLPAGAVRTELGEVALQITLLLVTAAVVSIAARAQEKEREQYQLGRAQLWQLSQRIEIAKHVDEMLRPERLPSAPGLDIAFRFRPAAQPISGDYYDVIPLGERRWGICVADVRAKLEMGLAYLPFFKSALRLAARQESSPARVLRRVNREVAAEMAERGDPEAFIGVFYGLIDLDECRLAYANAGIEPPVLIPGADRKPFEMTGAGIVLGVLPDAAYDEQEVMLHTSDTLVVFTDGLTEVTDSHNRFLEREGLMEQILANAAAGSAEAVAHGIFEYVTRYGEGGRHRDDMTLIVVRITATDLRTA